MTISVNRSPAPVVRSTAESQTVAPAAPQSQAQASTGYSATSSYQTSSSASTGSSINADTQKAIDILGKTSGGEALKKFLSMPYMTSGEVSEAIAEFDKIAPNLSESDRAAVEQAVRYESCISGCINLTKSIMDRLMQQMKENNKMPQW